LATSRGMETVEHKLMMRLSVLLADVLILFPAIFMFENTNYLTVITLLLYPGLIIIDHGHFQYNNISLGLAMIAVSLVTRGWHSIGSFMFVCALNYKQMELYHAFPFFFYLLGICLQQRGWSAKIGKLVQIGLTVILTFLAIWSPFIMLGQDAVIQVVKRVFPFDRGLFEDKVANFWCTADILLKLKQKLSIPDLAKLCLVSTLFLSLPSNVHLLFKPSQKNFILALVNTSLVFFMFSYHVHEKTILLASIPMCLLSFSETDQVILRFILPWILTISTFSMTPLLIKDGLLIPTISLSALYLTVISNIDNLATIGQDTRSNPRSHSPIPKTPNTWLKSGIKILSITSIAGCCLILLLNQVVTPPSRYPYFWPMITCAYSAAHFLLALLFFHYVQFKSEEIPVRSSGKKLKMN